MFIPVTTLYSVLLALLFIVLSARTILVRQQTNTPLGSGTDDNLLRKIRVHGNFAEYIPLGLFLMLLAELQNAPVFILHAVGIAFILGRFLHMYGIDTPKPRLLFRIAGMSFTFTALILLAITLIWIRV